MRKLVLWGHHADEFREMFDLPDDKNLRLLEYGCGPTAVNKELTARGQLVTSCDPLFALDKKNLADKVELIFDDMVSKVVRDQAKFDFSCYGSLENLITKRREGMASFFSDYEQARREKRCLAITEQNLDFPDFYFDLALSSHYLFADLDDQDVDFHLIIIKELARVAKEVRIFPLIDRYNQPSPFLGPVLLGLQEENYGVEVREVAYHLQPHGNAMLRVWPQLCQV